MRIKTGKWDEKEEKEKEEKKEGDDKQTKQKKEIVTWDGIKQVYEVLMIIHYLSSSSSFFFSYVLSPFPSSLWLLSWKWKTRAKIWNPLERVPSMAQARLSSAGCLACLSAPGLHRPPGVAQGASPGAWCALRLRCAFHNSGNVKIRRHPGEDWSNYKRKWLQWSWVEVFCKRHIIV